MSNGNGYSLLRDLINDPRLLQWSADFFAGDEYFVVPVDIHEGEAGFTLKADLPGLTGADIDIKVENGSLTISGQRKSEGFEGKTRVERSFGKFSRHFILPRNVNPEGITAKVADGVLTVHIPRREDSKPKTIKVNVTGA